jgi:hypothetical protein
LRLQGATSGFSETVVIASDFVSSGDAVDVHFDNVSKTDSYTLTYIGVDGTETVIVQNAPYQSLQDNSLGNQQ